MTLMSRLMVIVFASGHVVLLIVNTLELRLPIPLQIQDCFLAVNMLVSVILFSSLSAEVSTNICHMKKINTLYLMLPNLVWVFIQSTIYVVIYCLYVLLKFHDCNFVLKICLLFVTSSIIVRTIQEISFCLLLIVSAHSHWLQPLRVYSFLYTLQCTYCTMYILPAGSTSMLDQDWRTNKAGSRITPQTFNVNRILI